MDTYRIEYRLSNRSKWRKLPVTSKAAFPLDELEARRDDISFREHCSRETVQMRTIMNGIIQQYH